jgi:PAS domain S-box-containing protein
LSVSPIFDETGKAIGASTIGRDITAKRRVEAELQRKEQELSDFVENATEGLHWANAQRRIIWANRSEMNMLGYAPEEYLGHNIEEFYVDSALAKESFARLLRGETLQNYEARLRCKDGSIKHVLIDSNALWRDGEFIHTRSFTRDITQRKQFEAAMAESEERFRTLSDSAPVMMWMIGADRRATFFNKPWLEFRGRSLQAELGDAWWDGIHFEDRKRFRNTFDTVFAARNWLETEFRLQRFDGEFRWMLCTGVPRVTSNGDFSGYIGSCLDITERKEAERFLEMHARRQARLIREEARGRRKAEQRARDQLTQLAHLSRFSTMGELATGLAHELNQPLCAIVNFTEACLELIASGGSSDELRGMMGEVATQAERAGEVIRHMREFVRKREPRRSAVAVNEIIRDVVVLMRNNVIKQGVDVQLDLSEPSLFVWADPIQIQQVVLNLVKNAVEAMQEGGSSEKVVTVKTCERTNSRVEVSICDLGPGISQDRLEQVFAPFHSTKESGMGMGLSISQSIIGAHDGEIWVTRNPDRGVTFHFTLPAARSSHDESYEPHSLHRG